MENQEKNLEIIKAISDGTRLEILRALQTGPKTGGEIEELIGKSQSTTSLQLKKLIEANIVTFKQESTKRNFQVKDPLIFDLLNFVTSYLSISNERNLASKIEHSKILLIGLDKSGKTSILYSILGEKNLMAVYSPEPTKGHKHMREITDILPNDLEDTYWEAGGQVLYRDQYLKNPDKFILGFDKIIYIIDIQDIERYQESIDYLKQILSILSKNEEKCSISIYLHKFDPGLETQKDFTEEIINERVINKIKKLMVPPLEFNYTILKTTIFTVYRRTLVHQSHST